jgi:spore coat protein CotH
VTNEDEDDWADLIDLIDILNNTPLESLDDSLGSRFQLVEWLKFIAVNNFLVSLDSYLGSGHNYFLYHREDIDKLIHLPWDMNEAFGTFRFGLTSFGTTCTPIR